MALKTVYLYPVMLSAIDVPSDVTGLDNIKADDGGATWCDVPTMTGCRFYAVFPADGFDLPAGVGPVVASVELLAAGEPSDFGIYRDIRCDTHGTFGNTTATVDLTERPTIIGPSVTGHVYSSEQHVIMVDVGKTQVGGSARIYFVRLAVTYEDNGEEPGPTPEPEDPPTLAFAPSDTALDFRGEGAALDFRGEASTLDFAPSETGLEVYRDPNPENHTFLLFSSEGGKIV